MTPRSVGRGLVALGALVALLPVFAWAQAPEGDTASVDRPQARIGEQATLRLEVITVPGATVEVDAAAAGWNGVEVIRVASQQVTEAGGAAHHLLDVVVAGFLPGQQSFAPSVNVIAGTDVQPRQLPPVTWEVTPSLAADAPLVLSPLDAPVAIGGAESPLLRPAIVAGSAATGAVLFVALWWLALCAWRRLRSRAAPPAAQPLGPPLLANAESLIGSDPVAAYRELAAVVRGFLTRHYAFPAHALTTFELQQHMESEGVDRWQARLVGGLLEECDAVVYAGYLPAMERREADLNMAREIVGPD
jgi:hypothetical protein